MYRCQLCGQSSKPGQARLLHVVYRSPLPHESSGRQIVREIPVCQSHYAELGRGRSYEDLRNECRIDVEVPVIEIPIPLPPPPPVIGKLVEILRPPTKTDRRTSRAKAR